MNEKDFLLEIKKLTAVRAFELEQKLELGIHQGSQLRWVHGLLESNKQWHEAATHRLAEITVAEDFFAKRGLLKSQTFRANDE
jgi:hypothetical protein